MPMQVIAVAIFALFAWLLVPHYLEEKAKENVVTNALQMAQQFKILRAYYSDKVVKKVLNTTTDLKISHQHATQSNTIPLPASLIHDMSVLINNQNKNIKIKFYSPFPFKNRQQREMDAFGKAAWAALKLNPTTPYQQQHKVNGRTVIQVAVGDIMVQQICIDCHNSHPLSLKTDWQLGELRGVLEITTDITPLIKSGQVTGRYLALGLIIFFGVIFTITFRKTFFEVQYWAQELTVSEQKLAASVFDTMNQGVVVTDQNNRIISINMATTKITGYTIDDIQGRDPKIFASGRHDRLFYEEMWQSLTTTGYWENEIWDRHKNGQVCLKWMTINVIYNKQGSVSQYISIFSDITERKKTDELIWKQANFDALTKLANRSLFHKRFQQELDRCQRSGGTLAIIYLDLDGFKDINDSLGHAAGDVLLIEVAQRLQKYSRKTDVVARLGGDEFSLLTPGFLQPEQVGSIAQQILEALAKPITILGREIHISASIGIAIYPDDGQSLEELSKHADIAMYQAKKSGKNQFQYFCHEMKTKALHRLSLIHDLHIALDKLSFQIHYQPKIRLVDNKIIGMEALIRWTKPSGEIITPADFIPCAEETGMIIPIGDWVLTEACHQTKVWNEQFKAPLHIAVNLSARQFHRHNITDRVLTILETHALSPHLLELEITESILMNDVEEAIQVMAALRSHGISVAIDDFGTGFSSLSYLKRFPISTLKIDKSFIRDLTEVSKDAAIIRSIITLAESLNLEVVAEGVETVEQLTFLSQQKCDIAQGYHLAKPMSADEFERFLFSNSDRLI